MKFDITTYDINWFRDRYLDGSLIIKPPYQRKPVWVEQQKCNLIETILLNYPIPEVFIQTFINEENMKYSVVDGQQRIRTVLQYISAEIDPSEVQYNKFRLTKLKFNSPWNDKSFEDLLPDERMNFLSYRFSIRCLYTEDYDEIRDMFNRLKRYHNPLTPQELRNATYSGPFARLSEELADNEYWTENAIFTALQIRRMKDIEFMSELLIGVMHGPQNSSAIVIDEYYSQYEDFDDEFPDQRKYKKIFMETIEIINEILPDIKDIRWSNRADFYSLFITIANLLKPRSNKKPKIKDIRSILIKMHNDLEQYNFNQNKKTSEYIKEYYLTIREGTQTKTKRKKRYVILTDLLEKYFI